MSVAQRRVMLSFEIYFNVFLACVYLGGGPFGRSARKGRPTLDDASHVWFLSLRLHPISPV